MLNSLYVDKLTIISNSPPPPQEPQQLLEAPLAEVKVSHTWCMCTAQEQRASLLSALTTDSFYLHVIMMNMLESNALVGMQSLPF